MPFRGWFILAALALAQAQPPDTILRTTTQLVQVRVAVHDKKGLPVPGLTREDFHLFDDKHERPITLFSAEAGVAAPTPDDPLDPAQPHAATLRRDDYAIVLLDWVNTSLVDRLFAFDEFKDLLKTFQPGQKTAVYALDPDLRMAHQFTTETDTLLDALEDTGPAGYTPSDQPSGANYDRFLPLGSPIQRLMVDMRVHDSFAAFRLLADRLSHMPGRKSLIWISDGFPILTYVTDVEKLVAELNRADIAVYAIAAQGLGSSGSHTPGFPLMGELSQRTGGTFFHGRNDLAVGIRTALEDISISYTLGFNAPEETKPGLHAIEVRTTRPGLSLRHRESYALPKR